LYIGCHLSEAKLQVANYSTRYAVEAKSGYLYGKWRYQCGTSAL